MMIHIKAGDEHKTLAKKKSWSFSKNPGAEKKTKYEMVRKKGADSIRPILLSWSMIPRKKLVDYKKAFAGAKMLILKSSRKRLCQLWNTTKRVEEASATVK